jgi:hypothetical protein
MRFSGAVSLGTSQKTLNKLKSFHNGTIRRILKIKWSQVREDHIKNSEVRRRLYNIPNIDAFINRRTMKYIGKVSRRNDDNLPKKFLAAWINGKRKNGAPQLTCNNNFARAIDTNLSKENPLSNNQALLKEWVPLAHDKNKWQHYILTPILNPAIIFPKMMKTKKRRTLTKTIVITNPCKNQRISGTPSHLKQNLRYSKQY